MSQQGLWKEAGVLPAGKMGGEKWRKQGLNEIWNQITCSTQHFSGRCLVYFKVILI